MDDKIAAEIIKMRSDILYLVRLVEKLETKIVKLEQAANKQPPSANPFAGMHVEKL